MYIYTQEESHIDRVYAIRRAEQNERTFELGIYLQINRTKSSFMFSLLSVDECIECTE